jgi:hypothetical protein
VLDNSYVWNIDDKKFISDLKVEEQIFGDGGSLSTIAGEFPEGKKKLYKMTFSNLVCIKSSTEQLSGLLMF